MNPRRLAGCPLVLLLLAASLPAAEHTVRSFRKLQLTDKFWSEGATFADLNRDGHHDILSGPYWWAGPDFTVRREYYPATTTFTRRNADGTESVIEGFEGALGVNNKYSDNFFAFTHDFTGDGWPDILIIGFPGQDASWFENPGPTRVNQPGHWKRHRVFAVVDNESPTWTDLTGDGQPELVCGTTLVENGRTNGYLGYVTPDWGDPRKPWTFHKITPPGNYRRFTHGLGVGDVNGDGRTDLLEKDGWWEQPASLAGDPSWKFHPHFFGTGGAQMYAYDVNGDGFNDIITSLAAHGFGLAWFEQYREDGAIRFRSHIIMNKEPHENRYGLKFAQLHAIDLADMDGDGLKDIVTGKRFWAHGPKGDIEANADPVTCFFKLVRGSGGTVDFVPHLIASDVGVGTQVVTGDINGDGLPDVIVGNKRGTFVLLQETRRVSREQWEQAQPKVLYPDAGRAAGALTVYDRSGQPAASEPGGKRVAPPAVASPHAPRDGILPAGRDGRPLNLNFEAGDLRDWTATGAAFAKQPIRGDTVAKRLAHTTRTDRSHHEGDHWIGGYEAGGDKPTGTLSSAPFKVTHPWASFLVGGGNLPGTRVELVRADNQQVIFTARGARRENLQPVAVDLQAQAGREIFIRLVDEETGAWGHINFDDFRFHPAKPAWANPAPASQPR